MCTGVADSTAIQLIQSQKDAGLGGTHQTQQATAACTSKN